MSWTSMAIRFKPCGAAVAAVRRACTGLALLGALVLPGCVGTQMVIEHQDGEAMRARYPGATLDLWPISESLLVLDSMTTMPEWERVYGQPGTWRQARTLAGIEHDALSPAHRERRWQRHVASIHARLKRAADVRAGRVK